jgi:hypothetical protein
VNRRVGVLMSCPGRSQSLGTLRMAHHTKSVIMLPGIKRHRPTQQVRQVTEAIDRKSTRIDKPAYRGGACCDIEQLKKTTTK